MYDQREELAKLGMINLGKGSKKTNDYQSLQDMGYTTQQIVYAIMIAQKAAKAMPPSYYTGDCFVPHDWVVLAILNAIEDGGA